MQRMCLGFTQHKAHTEGPLKNYRTIEESFVCLLVLLRISHEFLVKLLSGISYYLGETTHQVPPGGNQHLLTAVSGQSPQPGATPRKDRREVW